jgi:hypothetical protein
MGRQYLLSNLLRFHAAEGRLRAYLTTENLDGSLGFWDARVVRQQKQGQNGDVSDAAGSRDGIDACLGEIAQGDGGVTLGMMGKI